MAGQFLKVFEDGAKKAFPKAARKSAFQQRHLEVRMFNVGDGEAILIFFPEGGAWLVDGGAGIGNKRNKTLADELVKYLKQQQEVLEVLVPTHPHKDHVGAVAHLLGETSVLAPKLMYYYSGDPTWNQTRPWLDQLKNALAQFGQQIEQVSLQDAHREASIAPGVEAHLFAGSGQQEYTSVFIHLRFGSTRLLFTGDSYCKYELQLIKSYTDDFRADVLKVTHHGSSSGTGNALVAAVKPGMAIASTADDGGHRLEKDTLARLGGRPGPRAVFETIVDGDITLRTDGLPYGNGVLYQVEFETPGRFATALGATTLPLSDVDQKRKSSNEPDCKLSAPP